MFLNYWLLINLLIRAIVVDALVSGFTDNELQELSEKCNEDSEHHCSLLHYYNGITKLKVDRLVDQSVKTRLLRVDAVPPATLYSTLFEDYVVTNRPFKSSMAAATEPVASVASGLALCNATRDRSLDQLSDVEASDIRLPALISNSYLRRLERSDRAIEYLDYKRHWPAAVTVGSDGTAPYQCPAGMHAVLWGASSPLRVLVYPPRASAALQQALLSAGEMAADRVPPHIALFSGPTAAQRLDSAETVLSTAADYVFVPGTHLAALQPLGGREEQEQEGFESPVLVLRHCLLDASNINAFRDAIALFGLAYAQDAELAQSVASHALDVSMAQAPQELSLPDYRRAAGATAPDSAKTAADSAPDAPTARRDRRRRAGGGASDFKQWQDSNHWNLLISALTLPTPQPPAVAKFGRDFAVLSWDCAFRPAAQDKTLFAFRVFVCPSDPERQDLGPSGCRNFTVEHALATSASGPAFSVSVRDLQPRVRYSFALALVHGKTQSTPSPQSLEITTLPVTVPSPPRPASGTGAPLATAHCVHAPAAMLSFAPPEDSGGAEVAGYEVSARHLLHSHREPNDPLGSPAYGEWYGLGLFPSSAPAQAGTCAACREILVGNLLLGRAYQFKLSAVNRLGASEATPPSGPVACTSLEVGGEGAIEGLAVYGPDHPKYGVGLLDNAATAASGRPLLSLDFVQQTVLASGSDKAFPFWRCHWSPRSLRVESGFALVGRAAGDGDDIRALADAVRGRVAVAVRGGRPIASKARLIQDAGALALLIVDGTDSHCRDYDQQCLPGASRSNGEGFAAQDTYDHWRGIHLPIGFLLRETANTLFGTEELNHYFGEIVGHHSEL